MKYILLLLSFGFCSSTALYAQDVRIDYPYGLTKISSDNGKTWTVKKQKKVIFHYPFGIKKTSLDNGKSWTTSSFGQVTFIYPDYLRKTSLDKGKNWVIEESQGLQVSYLNVFPNPAGAFTRIDLNGYGKQSNAPELFTLSGQYVDLPTGSYTQEDGLYYLNTNSLQNGYYFLRFKNEKGHMSAKIQVLH